MRTDFVLLNYRSNTDVARLIGEIEDTFPHPHTVTVIDNTHINRGFARGCNLGAWIEDGDIIAFLNPDIHLVPGWADETMAAFAADDNLVICGPRLDDGYPWPRVSKATNGISEWVCGACYFVRRDWFESVGGFDERYVFSFEETDLCRQAEEAGRRVASVNVDNPTVKHIRHDTPFHSEQFFIASAQYKEKWDR